MNTSAHRSKTKHLDPGEILFLEGDEGEEMFIVKRGQIQILHREGAKMVQLATLGPGSVIGELSLLDSQPRSATARAVNHSELVIIDQAHLNKTYSKIPSWLSSLIRIMVGRLRETNQRKHLRDVIESFPIVLKYLAQYENSSVIDFREFTEVVTTIYGLSESDLNKVLKLLKLFNFIDLDRTNTSLHGVVIIQHEALIQYYDYLGFQLENKVHPWAKLSHVDILNLQLLMDTANKRGSKSKDKLKFNQQHLNLELDNQGFSHDFIHKDTLLNYQKLNFISIVKKDLATERSRHIYEHYLISPEYIQTAIRFKTRINFFTTDLKEHFSA